MIEVKIMLIKLVPIDGGDYDFATLSLGLFTLEVVPRIGETVYYEVDKLSPGYFYVKNVHHHLEPKSPVTILVISPDDEDYYDGKK